MAPVFLLLAILLQLQGIKSDSFTQHPERKEFCDYDAFISSTPFNGKVFLIPANINERQSDWYGARNYCAEHCADSVTIHSEEENNFLHKFLQILNTFDGQTWIGGQVVQSVGTWSNGEPFNYSNPISAADFQNTKEPSENCIHTYTVNSKWYAYMNCQVRTNNIACQRDASWRKWQ